MSFILRKRLLQANPLHGFHWQPCFSFCNILPVLKNRFVRTCAIIFELRRANLGWNNYCKVALATLHTELTWIQDGGCITVNPNSPRLSMPYDTIEVSRCDAYLELCTGGYAHARRPPCQNQLSCLARSKMASIKAVVARCFARFLHCVKVYHNLDHLDVLYMCTVAFDFIRITLKLVFLDIATHVFRSSS